RSAQRRAGALAQPAEQQRWEEHPQAPHLEDRQVADREKHCGEEERRAKPSAEEGAPLGPRLSKPGLEIPAIEKLLGDGHHQQLINGPKPEVGWQSRVKSPMASVRRQVSRPPRGQPLHGFGVPDVRGQIQRRYDEKQQQREFQVESPVSEGDPKLRVVEVPKTLPPKIFRTFAQTSGAGKEQRQIKKGNGGNDFRVSWREQ